MAVTMSLTDPYLAEFESYAKAIGDAEPSWLHALRKSAMAAFRKSGFPTVKNEDWKHTNVAPVVRMPFRFEPQVEPPRIPGDLIEGFTFGVLKCSQLVFVNGRFAPKLSYLRWLPEGVRIRSLQETIHFDPKAVEPHLAKVAAFDTHAFAALNTAFLQDGAFVHVPKGRVVEEPIHLLYVSTSQDPAAVSYPRNLILLDDESQATVIESYVGLDKGAYFTNAVTEVRVGNGGVLEHYKMQRESEAAYHFSKTSLVEGRSSSVASTSVDLGGGLVRNDINTRFEDEGGSLLLNGLYVLHDGQHCDNHTFIDHATPNCTSLELFKGILDAKSRGIFYGKILVRKDAQKTNARQTNKNLLLSNEAFADSTPGLEILADDVRCNHGSTVGQLDENAVFYLRSRGIDEAAARTLLTYAFAGEVINQVKVASMRIKLDQLILSRLPGSDVIQEAL